LLAALHLDLRVALHLDFRSQLAFRVLLQQV
jgi:hypothetical protein